MFQKSVLLILALISIAMDPVLSASISAQVGLALRNGVINIIYNGDSSYGTHTINLNLLLPESPSGVCLALRSHTISTSTSMSVDYSFKVSSASTTGFTLIATSSILTFVSYSKVVLNYITAGDSSNLKTYSIIPNSTYTASPVGLDTRHEWRYTVTGITDSLNQLLFFHFVPVLAVTFTSQIKVGVLTEAYVPPSMAITTYIVFPFLTLLSEIKISSVVFSVADFKASTNYQVFYSQNLSLSVGSIDISNSCSANVFLGVSLITTSTISSKADYSLELSPDIGSNTDYNYVLSNPRTSISVSYSISSMTAGSFHFITWVRYNCTQAPYIYSNRTAQLCYDVCSFGNYGNSNFDCVTCSSCLDITTCTLCFTNACLSGYYFTNTTTPFGCLTCDSASFNCLTCDANLTGVYCTSCTLLLPVELVSGICVFCNSSSYISAARVCTLCNSTMSNCLECQTDGSACLLCDSSQLVQLRSGNCLPCDIYSYFTGSLVCDLCNNSIPNCESCSDDGSICESCYISSSTELVGNACVPCGIVEYFDSTLASCEECNLAITDCLECAWNSSVLECTRCNSLLLYVENGTCHSCTSDQYMEISNNTCMSCSFDCISCINYQQCLACTVSSTIMLKDGYCVQCNNNSLIISTLPYCRELQAEIDEACIQSRNSNSLDIKCLLSTNISETILITLSSILSIPNINAITSTFIQFIICIDQLSYYAYHNIPYYRLVNAQFEFIANISFSRFFPDYLAQHLYIFTNHKFFLSQDLGRSPRRYADKQQDIYFAHNTVMIWLGLLPLSILGFIAVNIIRWIVRKSCNTNILKSFQFVGVIVINLFQTNLQFLSFGCFTNLFQIVPLGYKYTINLILSHVILFLVLLYSIGGMILFGIIHTKLRSSRLGVNIFNQTTNRWFVTFNLLQVAAGFIHAYFYYQPLVQSILLTIMYVLRCALFLIVLRHTNDRNLNYSFEFIGSLLLSVMQAFFLSELFIQRVAENVDLLILMGNIEFIMILFMVANKIIYTVVNICVVHIVYLKEEVIIGSKDRRDKQIKDFMDIMKKNDNVEVVKETKFRISGRNTSVLEFKSFALSDVTHQDNKTISELVQKDEISVHAFPFEFSYPEIKTATQGKKRKVYQSFSAKSGESSLLDVFNTGRKSVKRKTDYWNHVAMDTASEIIREEANDNESWNEDQNGIGNVIKHSIESDFV